MRVSFLILNHRDQAQLLRLVATLRRQLRDAPIAVHNDRFRAEVDHARLAAFDAHLLTSDRPVIWGDFTLVEAYWRSMAWMITHCDFDWLVLLSAQDYPIKPLDALGAYLRSTGADALLRAVPVDQIARARDRRNRSRRYYYQYRRPVSAPLVDSGPGRPPGWIRPWAGALADMLNNTQPWLQIYKMPDDMPWRIGWRARRTPFTEDQPCWFGSTWGTLSRRAAESVAHSVRSRPDYVDYYRRTVIPDESATATLICNAPELRVESRNLHHTRWTNPRSGHPDVFTTEDLPELIAAPEFFARKFDIAKDAEVLDELDRMLEASRGTAAGRQESRPGRQRIADANPHLLLPSPRAGE